MGITQIVKRKRTKNTVTRLSIRTKQVFSIKIVALTTIVIVAGIFLVINLLSKNTFGISSMGVHGTKTISTSNVIVNEFTSLSANAAAGASSITVAASSLNANSRFSGSLQSGELIMIIQMQGATIYSGNDSGYGSVSAYNNSGKYEFAEVSGVPNSTTINLYSTLKNSYTSTGKVQVVRVPRYSTFTVNSGASATTDTWNGTIGGIFAIEVSGQTTINGTVNVSGKGFRGGRVDTRSSSGDPTFWKTTSDRDGAEKGEGIAGDWTLYGTLGGQYGRGAAANGGGGGGTHNCGGGGGANGGSVASWNGRGVPNTSTANYITAWNREYNGFASNNSSGGGKGGYSCAMNSQDPINYGPNAGSWGCDNRQNNFGAGGRPLDNTGNRIFFGGGGGAGDQNDGSGFPGGAGGGIAFIIGGNIVNGSGTINADGVNAASTIGPGGADGGSGGGGGGTIMIYTSGSTISNLTLSANGGKGGNQDNTTWPNECEGPGGGGGGGYIQTTNNNSLIISVAGGLEGTSNSTTVPSFPMNGSTKGNSGAIGNSIPIPYSSYSPLPVKMLSFSVERMEQEIKINWKTASEVNNSFFTVERSNDAITFSEIATINGAGNSTQVNAYEYIDKSPEEGNNFYRLKQTDYDGKTETFAIKMAVYSSKNIFSESVTVFPNSVRDHAGVRFYSGNNTEAEIILIDVTGKIIFKESLTVISGNNSFEFPFDFSALNRGIYFVKINHDKIQYETTKMYKD